MHSHFHTRTFVSLLFVVIFTFTFLTISAIAQSRGFKVGDRVSASPMSLKDEKYWRACTVTEVHNFVPKRAYSIICDPLSPGGSTSSFLVNEDWVKPLAAGETGGAGAPADRAPAQEQPVARAAGQGGPVACPPSNPRGGKTAMENGFRESIVRGFSHEPQPNEDGRITVTIQNMSVGQAHGYRVLEDPNEARGKTIYPVHATFTTCTDYFRRIVYTKRERMFSCYKNTAGEWVCDIFAAVNTNVKDETKSLDKPR